MKKLNLTKRKLLPTLFLFLLFATAMVTMSLSDDANNTTEKTVVLTYESNDDGIPSIEILAPCTFSSASITNVQCNDASTPNDPSDDFITFDIDIASFTGLSDLYCVKSNTGIVYPSAGNVNVTESFRLGPGSAGAGNVTLTIEGDAGLFTLDIGANSNLEGGVVFFDVTNDDEVALNVTGMKVHLDEPSVVEIYSSPTTHVGKENNAAAWTLIATGTVGDLLGTGDFPFVGGLTDLDVSFNIPPGTMGIAVRGVTSRQFYTNGNGANQNHSFGLLSISAGTATNGFFGAATPATNSTSLSPTSVFTPRVWNGAFIFSNANSCTTTAMVTDPGACSAAGCTTFVECIDELIAAIEALNLPAVSESTLKRIVIMSKDRESKDSDLGAINLLDRFNFLADVHVTNATDAMDLKDKANNAKGFLI